MVHHWSTSAPVLDLRVAESSTAVKHMVFLEQQLCIRNYSGVNFGQPCCSRRGFRLYISLFRHFWHKVVAVAFDGPPIVGPLLYRFMARSTKGWCLLNMMSRKRKL